MQQASLTKGDTTPLTAALQQVFASCLPEMGLSIECPFVLPCIMSDEQNDEDFGSGCRTSTQYMLQHCILLVWRLAMKCWERCMCTIYSVTSQVMADAAYRDSALRLSGRLRAGPGTPRSRVGPLAMP